MRVSLTKAEMLERRRMASGLEPLRDDCTVELTAGIDVDRVLEGQLRWRYLDLLDNGERRKISAEDVSDMTALSTVTDSSVGGVLLTPPDNCRRALDVRLEGWVRPVEILPVQEAGRVMSRQLNPFTAATADCPAAVVIAERRGTRPPEIMAWPAALNVSLLTATVDYGPERYVLDECGIEDLFSDNIVI